MGATAVLAGIAIAGTATTIIGRNKEAKAAEDVAKREAALKDEQARELVQRAFTNIRAMRRGAEVLKGTQIRAFARSGVELEGGALQVLTETAGEVEIRALNAIREARFKEDQLLAGADVDLKLASDRINAVGIQNMGTIFNTGVSLARASGKADPNTGMQGHTVEGEVDFAPSSSPGSEDILGPARRGSIQQSGTAATGF